MINSHNFELVFRIRDILIRIRILGSVHWITDPDPALFGSVFQNGNNQKITFFGKCLLTVGTLTSIISMRSLRCIKPSGRIMLRKPFKNCKQYLFNNYSTLRIYKIKTEKQIFLSCWKIGRHFIGPVHNIHEHINARETEHKFVICM
jgi:hypothetical protein